MLQDIFKALADPARLRILRALGMAELSVAELVTVLGLPQPTVSRHLKPLRQTQLAVNRREGTTSFYRRGPAFEDEPLAAMLDEHADDIPGRAEDRASVRRVLEARRRHSRSFFDRMAGCYGTLTEPGGGWQALAAALAAGFTGCTVADLGAGEGDLTLLLARHARQVTAVDQSRPMLRFIQDRLQQAGIGERVKTVEADIESLPLPDRHFDAVFLSQALHHAAHPPSAIAEAARILKSGGRLLVLDLHQHQQEWVRQEWADQWLGFDLRELRAWISASGMRIERCECINGSTPGLQIIICTAKKRKTARKELKYEKDSTRKKDAR